MGNIINKSEKYLMCALGIISLTMLTLLMIA